MMILSLINKNLYKTILCLLTIIFSNNVFAYAEKVTKQEIRDLFVVSGLLMKKQTKYSDASKTYGYYLFDKRDNNACDKPIGSFALMDHEGGKVKRFNSKLLSANKFLENKTESLNNWNDDVLYMKSKCIDVILGPVSDVNLYWRSYTNEYKQNFEVINEISNVINKNNMKFSVKHFPGVGFICKEDRGRWEIQICDDELDLLEDQFTVLKENKNIKSIMISNNIYLLFDEKNSTMSQKVYDKINETGNYFKITDSLDEVVDKPSIDDWITIIINADAIIYQIPKNVEIVIDKVLSKINQNKSYIKMIKEKKLRKEKFFHGKWN